MACEINAKWRTNGDGTRCCKFCGSLHPVDFIDIMWRYSQGEEGYSFDTTTKSYKLYGHRPGVRNAGDGGIKFYMNHATPEHRLEFEAAYTMALTVFREKMVAKWGPAAANL